MKPLILPLFALWCYSSPALAGENDPHEYGADRGGSITWSGDKLPSRSACQAFADRANSGQGEQANNYVTVCRDTVTGEVVGGGKPGDKIQEKWNAFENEQFEKAKKDAAGAEKAAEQAEAGSQSYVASEGKSLGAARSAKKFNAPKRRGRGGPVGTVPEREVKKVKDYSTFDRLVREAQQSIETPLEEGR